MKEWLRHRQTPEQYARDIIDQYDEKLGLDFDLPEVNQKTARWLVILASKWRRRCFDLSSALREAPCRCVEPQPQAPRAGNLCLRCRALDYFEASLLSD